MKNIAVQTDTWSTQFELLPPDIGGSISFKVTSSPSEKDSAGGKKCWLSPISFEISGYMDGTVMDLPSGTGSGSITGSSTITKVETQPALLEGDSTVVKLIGQHTVPGSSPQTVTLDVTVRIKSAGQDKVQTL